MVKKVPKYIVTAKLVMKSTPLTKAAAQKLMRDSKKKNPNVVVTMKRV